MQENPLTPSWPDRRAPACARLLLLLGALGSAHRPAASRKGHERNVAREMRRIPGRLFDPEYSGYAPPSCRRLREARRGRLGGVWRLLSPASSLPLSLSRVASQGPEPQSPGEAWPLCLGSGISSEPTSREGNKEPRPPRPSLRLSPTRRFTTFLKTPLSAWEAQVSTGGAHTPAQSPFLTIELG